MTRVNGVAILVVNTGLAAWNLTTGVWWLVPFNTLAFSIGVYVLRLDHRRRQYNIERELCDARRDAGLYYRNN